jgi:drug/metabolite transporter (DMT)-like permease/ribosomal protein L40E
MRERLRIDGALGILITALIGVIWIIINNFLSNKYPIFSTLLLDLIFPIGALLLHAYIFWKTPPPKGRRKWFAIGALGMAGMTTGGLLNPGPWGLISLPVGILVWAFGMHKSWPRVTTEPFKLKAQATPKSFLKRCVKCGAEIPIASEKCPLCGQTQP